MRNELIFLQTFAAFLMAAGFFLPRSRIESFEAVLRPRLARAMERLTLERQNYLARLVRRMTGAVVILVLCLSAVWFTRPFWLPAWEANVGLRSSVWPSFLLVNAVLFVAALVVLVEPLFRFPVDLIGITLMRYLLSCPKGVIACTGFVIFAVATVLQFLR